ncbi:MAG TPA: PilZ domain-containing protein [Fervidobacterium sp.]|nr:PilZ domain-containing protein [Fervidobacterium sp.]HOQ40160.1 PilZ domain-containing protein [Fervidobacterium sp.]HPT53393.1 PilZ domain-containing protein [Fervidobacterium sp.]HPZ16869.1 PilZ domain-containing protein [Fervidobacterium sp.]HQE47866.1 PilZ domain-containing protein [Fervidobacterium sp.]
MTLEEYVNVNLKNIVIRGFGRESAEYTLKLREIRGRQFRVAFIVLVEAPEILRIDIPIEGFVLTLIGKLMEKQEEDFLYSVFDKAGILQRRTKPRYASFEKCSISGFESLIIDVSENGFQGISEYKPSLKETIEIALSNSLETGTVMWMVEEEECYRFGVYIQTPSDNWESIYEKYRSIGEKL